MVEGRGTSKRAREPVGMSDKSTQGDKQEIRKGCFEFGTTENSVDVKNSTNCKKDGEI